MGDPGRMIRAGFLPAYPERILGVEIEYPVVLDVDLRDAVIGGGKQEAVIKTNLPGPGLELVIPLGTEPGVSQSKVPFPDYCSFVPRLLEHVGQGVGILGYDQRRTGRSNACVLSAKGVGPR